MKKINSHLVLSYITYLSPYLNQKQPLQLVHYHYFCCYLWVLKDLSTDSLLLINIKKGKKKYISLVKSSKCHKKGKYTFWYKYYKVIINFFNFIKKINISNNKYFEIFFYLQKFYLNLSSNLFFLKKISITLTCTFQFVKSLGFKWLHYFYLYIFFIDFLLLL